MFKIISAIERRGYHAFNANSRVYAAQHAVTRKIYGENLQLRRIDAEKLVALLNQVHDEATNEVQLIAIEEDAARHSWDMGS